jgi:hypothetical protein
MVANGRLLPAGRGANRARPRQPVSSVDGLACRGPASQPRQTGHIELASVAADGGLADGSSVAGAISPDGRYVPFISGATNLVPGDTNGTTDVFVRDLWTALTTRVSVDSDGSQTSGQVGNAAISADGRFVVFDSDASTLVPDDTNGVTDVFVHDTLTHTTQLVSLI